MFDRLRLAAVLSRAGDLHATPDPRCRIDKDVRKGNGWLVDRFLPKKPIGASLMLLHGWTLRGKDDLRLQAFARSLAIGGVECLVPCLPGLADLRFLPSDVAGLRALLDECPSPPGIMGFSFGGSYGLLAASDCSRSPRFVISVSGYGDLPATYRHAMAWGRRVPEHPETSEAWVYLKLVLAWRLREVIPLSSEAQQELRGLLEAFCEGKSTEPGWRFCQRILGDKDWEAEDGRQQDAADLSALSLIEHPPRLACPTVVLHDKGDDTVPSSEVQVVAEAVRRGSPHLRVDVMVTDLLNHVTPGLAFRPGEIMRLLRLLSPLVKP
jgi:pimeloyl-ACP methyl ester carboxylesterase